MDGLSRHEVLEIFNKNQKNAIARFLFFKPVTIWSKIRDFLHMVTWHITRHYKLLEILPNSSINDNNCFIYPRQPLKRKVYWGRAMPEIISTKHNGVNNDNWPEAIHAGLWRIWSRDYRKQFQPAIRARLWLGASFGQTTRPRYLMFNFLLLPGVACCVVL